MSVEKLSPIYSHNWARCSVGCLIFSNGIDTHSEFTAKLLPCVDDLNTELGLQGLWDAEVTWFEAMRSSNPVYWASISNPLNSGCCFTIPWVYEQERHFVWIRCFPAQETRFIRKLALHLVKSDDIFVCKDTPTTPIHILTGNYCWWLSEWIRTLIVPYASIMEVRDSIPCETSFIKETQAKTVAWRDVCSLELPVFNNLVTYTHFVQRHLLGIAHMHSYCKDLRSGLSKYLIPHLMLYVITLDCANKPQECAMEHGNLDSARTCFSLLSFDKNRKEKCNVQ
jgi:hypothetical protein